MYIKNAIFSVTPVLSRKCNLFLNKAEKHYKTFVGLAELLQGMIN